ncbi:MAG: DUF2784 domain-containing protein [Terriglobales bacterium]
MPNFYGVLIGAVLAVHALFILWVIFGAALTRGRRGLALAHLACLAWGVVIEVAPWPCPLTLLEQSLERTAGRTPYQGAFILHYLRAFVYPNISGSLLTVGAIAVAAVNIAIYARRRI